MQWREQYGWIKDPKWREILPIVALEMSLFVHANFPFRSMAIDEVRKYYRPYLIRSGERLARGAHEVRWKFGRPGIRAQLVDLKARNLVMDYLLEGDDRSMHVLNAVSPAFTSALPFARFVPFFMVHPIRLQVTRRHPNKQLPPWRACEQICVQRNCAKDEDQVDRWPPVPCPMRFFQWGDDLPAGSLGLGQGRTRVRMALSTADSAAKVAGCNTGGKGNITSLRQTGCSEGGSCGGDRAGGGGGGPGGGAREATKRIDDPVPTAGGKLLGRTTAGGKGSIRCFPSSE